MSKATTYDGLPSGLAKEHKELIRQHRERHSWPEDENGDIEEEWEHTSNKVPKYLCDTFHELHEDGLTVPEILDLVHIESPNTIYYHLRKDCTHEYRSSITYDECGWMLYHAKNGAPSKSLSVLYDVSQKAVARHVTGRCDHNHSLEPIDPQELHNNGRRDTQMDSTVCPVCEEEFKHPVYKERTTCSEECNAKYASMKAKVKA